MKKPVCMASPMTPKIKWNLDHGTLQQFDLGSPEISSLQRNELEKRFLKRLALIGRLLRTRF